MALVILDRVKENTYTTGTGPFALLGAVLGFQPFAVIGNGNTTYYCAASADSGEWEVGIGAYSATGNTLSRDTILSSSNAGTAVNFTGGVKTVVLTQPAERAVYVNGSNVVAANGASVGTVTSVATGAGLSGGPITASGTIGLASGYGDTQNPYAAKTANYFLAAPNGASGVPTFRGIAAADIPTLNQNTTGTAGGLSSTLGVSRGGTGSTSFTANGVLFALDSTTVYADRFFSYDNGDARVNIPRLRITRDPSTAVSSGWGADVLYSQFVNSTSSSAVFFDTANQLAYYGVNVFQDSTGTLKSVSGTNSSVYRQDAAGGHAWFYGTTFSPGSNVNLDFRYAMFFNGTSLDVGSVYSNNSSSISTEGITLLRNYDSTNTTTTHKVYSTSAGANRFYVGFGGTVYATSTSISAISDQTLKTNIQDLETGLPEIMALRPRRFDWLNGDATGVAGFVAQEVEAVLPDLVSDYVYNKDENDNDVVKKSVKMGDILPTLVKAVQEQQAQIEILTARIAALETK